MADTKPNTKPDDNSGESDDPKDLRAKLEAANAEKKALADKVAAFEQRESLSKAGFGHLNARQQKSLLRELADEGVTEFTAEALEPIAKDLGFAAKAEGSTTSTSTTKSEETSNGDKGENSNPDTGFDPVAASMRGFDLMQTAQEAAINGRVNPDLETQMKEAKSPDELRAVIRNKGAQSGIVHSFDVE